MSGMKFIGPACGGPCDGKTFAATTRNMIVPIMPAQRALDHDLYVLIESNATQPRIKAARYRYLCGVWVYQGIE
jgi:hypothetical protein